MSIKEYVRERFFPHIWCPGCGHGIVLNNLLRAVEELGLKKKSMVMVSGIGCSSRISGYVDFHTLHTIHGRALAFATGVKMSQPELNVLIPMGDGDALAIGGNHFIHACRRNMDMTAIIMNNRIYGMTGGQFSPLTGEGFKATTAPMATIDRAFDVVDVASSAGATNAKLSDAQAGFEKGMSPTAAMLGGLNMVMLAGLIDALMVFSYPQLIIDSEIGEMIKRVYRGISLDKDEMALDLIKTIGSGGSYIDSQHTLKHMRTATYYPHIASRQSWQKWWDTGKYDTQTRALQRVWNILSGDNPAAFSPDVDAKIRATFSDSLHVSM